jgi:VIT1/CCC1 family predicted Fe2+/Mn2+ transporter
VVIGALLGKFTDGRWMRSALRHILVIMLSAATTFLLGKLFGAAVF